MHPSICDLDAESKSPAPVFWMALAAVRWMASRNVFDHMREKSSVITWPGV